MSQFLSLSAFAAEVGWQQDDIMKLITENRIKAYQMNESEPYIPKTELAKVRQMEYTTDLPSAKEESLVRDEADRVSRAYSRSIIDTERIEQETKIAERKSALARKRANQTE